ncbi:MAG: hypothetical protein K6T88_10785 [Bacillus sp. (in: Bacteria)]|nr:hypothetical protein [Bacillus sp. (in: firmicutes)]
MPVDEEKWHERSLKEVHSASRRGKVPRTVTERGSLKQLKSKMAVEI